MLDRLLQRIIMIDVGGDRGSYQRIMNKIKELKEREKRKKNFLKHCKSEPKSSKRK